MFFSNLATGIQYGGCSDLGQDLTAIMRCRFSRCGTGLKMTNQNCMGIYAWYCLFEDCRTAIDNGGGFAMPMCNYSCDPPSSISRRVRTGIRF